MNLPLPQLPWSVSLPLAAYVPSFCQANLFPGICKENDGMTFASNKHTPLADVRAPQDSNLDSYDKFRKSEPLNMRRQHDPTTTT